MEGITCRLLPYAVADGPHDMAADETLLHSALDGTASLRFYGWSPPTLSLGYFQAESVRHADPRLRALPLVRRPSGGRTLVHHHELTYALALPPGPPWQPRGVSWLGCMHGIVGHALRSIGISAAALETRARPFNGPFCFHSVTAGDVLVGEAKIVGSAQRKRRGALLQHGAILLARSPYTPSLPGLRELTGRDFGAAAVTDAIVRAFGLETGWSLAKCEWQERERGLVEKLVLAKYSQDWWNLKR